MGTSIFIIGNIVMRNCLSTPALDYTNVAKFTVKSWFIISTKPFTNVNSDLRSRGHEDLLLSRLMGEKPFQRTGPDSWAQVNLYHLFSFYKIASIPCDVAHSFTLSCTCQPLTEAGEDSWMFTMLGVMDGSPNLHTPESGFSILIVGWKNLKLTIQAPYFRPWTRWWRK